MSACNRVMCIFTESIRAKHIIYLLKKYADYAKINEILAINQLNAKKAASPQLCKLGIDCYNKR